MRANGLRLSLLLALSLVAAGCIEMTEEIWIEEDGSGRLVRDLSMAREMLDMGGAASGIPGGKGPADAIRQGLEEARAELAASPLVTGCEVSDHVEGSDHHFVIDVRVKDALSLGEVDELLQQSSSNADGAGQLPGGWELSVTRKVGGRYAVRVTPAGGEAEATADTAAGDPGQAMADAMGNAFMDSFFAGKNFRVVVHGPRITSSTGVIDPDRTRAEWVVPMSKLAAKQGFEEPMLAEVKMPGFPLLTVGLIAGIVVAGGAGLAGRSAMRRRRALEPRAASGPLSRGAAERGHWRTVVR